MRSQSMRSVSSRGLGGPPPGVVALTRYTDHSAQQGNGDLCGLTSRSSELSTSLRSPGRLVLPQPVSASHTLLSHAARRESITISTEAGQFQESQTAAADLSLVGDQLHEKPLSLTAIVRYLCLEL